MKAYFAFTPWQSTRRLYDVSLFGDTPQLCFETTHLGVLVQLYTTNDFAFAELTLPRVETARGYT